MTSVLLPAVESLGAPAAPNLYWLPQVTVAEPAAGWVIISVIHWPSTPPAGLATDRLAPSLTRKSFPSPAFTAMLAASASVTTAGATRPAVIVVWLISVDLSARRYAIWCQVARLPVDLQNQRRPFESAYRSPRFPL